MFPSYFQAVTCLQFHVGSQNLFRCWNLQYSFQQRKENISLSFILVLPHIRAHTCKTALISLKSKHTWYNHNQGLLPTSLNLTRSCCSHTLIILSLYCVKNSPMQPSQTGGIYHRNLVWVYMWAHSMEHEAGVCFSFAVHSLDLICDKLPKWPPDCSL